MTTFLQPRLVGKRFADHTLPLDLLKDFSALEEMLLEIAKRQYLLDNPTRKRLPKGFGKNISVSLAGIEEGSAILSLALTSYLATSSLLPPPEEKYLTEAKNIVIAAVAAAEAGENIPLDPVLLRYFDRFGRSLLDDEAIEFLNKKITVVLNQATRKKLIEKSKAKTWTENIVIKGCVAAADQNNNTFDLQLKDNTIIKIDYSEQFEDAIIEAFNGYKSKVLIEIKGVAVFDRINSIKKFESLGQVTVLDPLDIETRVEELGELPNGWLNGKGLALNKEKAQEFANLFYSFYSEDLVLPYLYPTAEGGLLAEWQLNNWDISLEINLNNLNAELHALNLQTDEEQEKELQLAKEASWQQLNTLLKQASEVQA